MKSARRVHEECKAHRSVWNRFKNTKTQRHEDTKTQRATHTRLHLCVFVFYYKIREIRFIRGREKGWETYITPSEKTLSTFKICKNCFKISKK